MRDNKSELKALQRAWGLAILWVLSMEEKSGYKIEPEVSEALKTVTSDMNALKHRVEGALEEFEDDDDNDIRGWTIKSIKQVFVLLTDKEARKVLEAISEEDTDIVTIDAVRQIIEDLKLEGEFDE